VYVGGWFGTIGSSTRKYLAAIGTAGVGTLADWDPSPDSGVNALAVGQSTI